MQIPSLPTLPAGYIATQADMTAASYGATFLLNKPAVRVVATSTQTIGTSETAVNFGSAAVNSDSMWTVGTPSVFTINTAGWYRVRYSVPVANVACNGAVKLVTGSNSPYGAGQSFYAWPSVTAAASPYNCCAAGGIFPFHLYVGDVLKIVCTAASSVSTTSTDSYPHAAIGMMSL